MQRSAKWTRKVSTDGEAFLNAEAADGVVLPCVAARTVSVEAATTV